MVDSTRKHIYLPFEQTEVLHIPYPPEDENPRVRIHSASAAR